MVSFFIVDSETLVLNGHRMLCRPQGCLRILDASESNDGPSFSKLTEGIISEGYSLTQYNLLPEEGRAYPTVPARPVVVGASDPNLAPSASYGGASSRTVGGEIPEEDLTDDDAEGEMDAEYEQGETT
jgi:hypothetical protein